MAIDVLLTVDVIEALENYIARVRPSEEIREKLDISYKIDGQSIYIFEIRPRPDKPKVKIECPVAKATFVKAKDHWKVFWLRADNKWHGYKPNLTVETVKQFVKLVEEDRYGCFWG